MMYKYGPHVYSDWIVQTFINLKWMIVLKESFLLEVSTHNLCIELIYKNKKGQKCISVFYINNFFKASNISISR